MKGNKNGCIKYFIGTLHYLCDTNYAFYYFKLYWKDKRKKASKYFYLEIPLNRLNESDRYYNYNAILFNKDGVLLKKDRTKLILEVSKKTSE